MNPLGFHVYIGGRHLGVSAAHHVDSLHVALGRRPAAGALEPALEHQPLGDQRGVGRSVPSTCGGANSPATSGESPRRKAMNSCSAAAAATVPGWPIIVGTPHAVVGPGATRGSAARTPRERRPPANLPLIKANLCPLSFIDVPERAYIESTLAVYEEQRIEPLRDLFAWAYERSCVQYRVTREALGQPDPIRLRYRPQLVEVVRETVLELRPPQ
jgi:hypothetical protein